MGLLAGLLAIHLQFWDRITQLLSCQITGKTLQGAIVKKNNGEGWGDFPGEGNREIKAGEGRVDLDEIHKVSGREDFPLIFSQEFYW